MIIDKLQSNKQVYMKQQCAHMPVLRGLQNMHKILRLFISGKWNTLYNFLEFSENAYFKN